MKYRGKVIDFPRGQQCLDMFIGGQLILDCSDDPDGYRQIMDILAAKDVIWASDKPANEVPYDIFHPIVWNFHESIFSTNGRHLTRTGDIKDLTTQQPDIICMTVSEMLEELPAIPEPKPLDLSFIYDL